LIRKKKGEGQLPREPGQKSCATRAWYGPGKKRNDQKVVRGEKKKGRARELGRRGKGVQDRISKREKIGVVAEGQFIRVEGERVGGIETKELVAQTRGKGARRLFLKGGKSRRSVATASPFAGDKRERTDQHL